MQQLSKGVPFDSRLYSQILPYKSRNSKIFINFCKSNFKKHIECFFEIILSKGTLFDKGRKG